MANVNRFNQAILLDNGFFLHCFSLYQPLFLIYHESNKLYSIKKPHADIQIPKKWRENKNFPALTYIRMYNRLYIYYPNWSWICMISIWIARIFHDRWPKKKHTHSTGANKLKLIERRLQKYGWYSWKYDIYGADQKQQIMLLPVCHWTNAASFNNVL